MAVENNLSFTFLHKLKEKIDLPSLISISNDVIKFKVFFPEAYVEEDIELLSRQICQESGRNFAFLKLVELGFRKTFDIKYSGLKVTFVWIK